MKKIEYFGDSKYWSEGKIRLFQIFRNGMVIQGLQDENGVISIVRFRKSPYKHGEKPWVVIGK